MSEMNIASCLNEAYVPYTYVMLKSLFESNKENDITVFLLHNGLTEKSTKAFFDLTKSYGQVIELLGVTSFSMDSQVYINSGWDEIVMYPLLLWDILPEKVERVLYLDGDVIVNKDLSDLYAMDFDGKDIIACPDILSSDSHKEYRSNFEDGTYFNTGMMVMNVAKNRGKRLMQQYEKTGLRLEHPLFYPSQDLLNYVHKNHVLYVDPLKYNFPTYEGRHKNGGYDEKRTRKEVSVLHFSEKKPWSEGDHKFYDIENLWWEVCKGSPFEKYFEKDNLICVIGLNKDDDVEKTMKSAREIYKDYFRGGRLVFADACGIGKGAISKELDVEYFDASKKEFSSTAELKNYVARKLSFDKILFLEAGEEVLEPVFYEALDAYSRENLLLEKGVGAFAHAFYSKNSFEDLGGFAEELKSGEEYEFVLRVLAYGYGDDMIFWKEEKSREEFDKALEDALKKRDYKRPILILTGESEYQEAYDSFVRHFGYELRRHGQGVIFMSDEFRNIDNITRLLTLSLKAVVGIQTKIYGVHLPAGEYLGNITSAPKFNILFEHPVYMADELIKEVNDVYVLSQDETYEDYIKKHMPQVKGAYHFPTAGVEWKKACDKEYDITFIGTYNDYRLQEDMMYTLPQTYRDLSKRFYRKQLDEPNKRAEEILDEIFDAMGYEVDEEEYTKTLFAMRYAVKAAMYKFREKIVEALLEGGITVDVFSDSWKKAPFAKHENLRIHEEVPFDDCGEVMSKSKLSLNVMSWHKGGMTERLSNAMLNKSVCVTDETTYIKREFSDEMLLFNLQDYSDLAERVKSLLDDVDKRETMAEAAYKKAKKTLTWSARAKEFIKLVDKMQK